MLDTVTLPATHCLAHTFEQAFNKPCYFAPSQTLEMTNFRSKGGSYFRHNLSIGALGHQSTKVDSLSLDAIRRKELLTELTNLKGCCAPVEHPFLLTVSVLGLAQTRKELRYLSTLFRQQESGLHPSASGARLTPASCLPASNYDQLWQDDLDQSKLGIGIVT